MSSSSASAVHHGRQRSPDRHVRFTPGSKSPVRRSMNDELRQIAQHSMRYGRHQSHLNVLIHEEINRSRQFLGEAPVRWPVDAAAASNAFALDADFDASFDLYARRVDRSLQAQRHRHGNRHDSAGAASSPQDDVVSPAPPYSVPPPEPVPLRTASRAARRGVDVDDAEAVLRAAKADEERLGSSASTSGHHHADRRPRYQFATMTTTTNTTTRNVGTGCLIGDGCPVCHACARRYACHIPEARNVTFTPAPTTAVAVDNGADDALEATRRPSDVVATDKPCRLCGCPLAGLRASTLAAATAADATGELQHTSPARAVPTEAANESVVSAVGSAATAAAGNTTLERIDERIADLKSDLANVTRTVEAAMSSGAMASGQQRPSSPPAKSGQKPPTSPENKRRFATMEHTTTNATAMTATTVAERGASEGRSSIGAISPHTVEDSSNDASPLVTSHPRHRNGGDDGSGGVTLELPIPSPAQRVRRVSDASSIGVPGSTSNSPANRSPNESPSGAGAGEDALSPRRVDSGMLNDSGAAMSYSMAEASPGSGGGGGGGPNAADTPTKGGGGGNVASATTAEVRAFVADAKANHALSEDSPTQLLPGSASGSMISRTDSQNAAIVVSKRKGAKQRTPLAMAPASGEVVITRDKSRFDQLVAQRQSPLPPLAASSDLSGSAPRRGSSPDVAASKSGDASRPESPAASVSPGGATTPAAAGNSSSEQPASPASRQSPAGPSSIVAVATGPMRGSASDGGKSLPAGPGVADGPPIIPPGKHYHPHQAAKQRATSPATAAASAADPARPSSPLISGHHTNSGGAVGVRHSRNSSETEPPSFNVSAETMSPLGGTLRHIDSNEHHQQPAPLRLDSGPSQSASPQLSAGPASPAPNKAPPRPTSLKRTEHGVQASPRTTTDATSTTSSPVEPNAPPDPAARGAAPHPTPTPTGSERRSGSAAASEAARSPFDPNALNPNAVLGTLVEMVKGLTQQQQQQQQLMNALAMGQQQQPQQARMLPPPSSAASSSQTGTSRPSPAPVDPSSYNAATQQLHPSGGYAAAAAARKQQQQFEQSRAPSRSVSAGSRAGRTTVPLPQGISAPPMMRRRSPSSQASGSQAGGPRPEWVGVRSRVPPPSSAKARTRSTEPPLPPAGYARKTIQHRPSGIISADGSRVVQLGSIDRPTATSLAHASRRYQAEHQVPPEDAHCPQCYMVGIVAYHGEDEH